MDFLKLNITDMKRIEFTEKTRRGLVKKLHVLLGLSKIDAAGKLAILAAYGVEHSNELSCDQLIEICDKLDSLQRGAGDEMDKSRKRVIAAIGGWLKVVGIAHDLRFIKGIACRASGYADFNKIPLERLRNLYATFLNKQKDTKRGRDVARYEELIGGYGLN